jgi:DNA-binding Lrp family transcriptional regulator
MQQKLLALLKKDSRLPSSTLAKALSSTPAKVEAEIARLQKSGKIVGFKMVLNSNDENQDEVMAVVEAEVATVRGRGFDEVAERVARFPEVVSAYLVSGGYDLQLVVRGKNLQAVARFVAEKLSVLEGVKGTRTHFLLKKYKEDNLSFVPEAADKRLAVSA